jgi:hypothetical protein
MPATTEVYPVDWVLQESVKVAEPEDSEICVCSNSTINMNKVIEGER